MADELNAFEEIGKILDRFRIAQGRDLNPDDREAELREMSFIEILGTAQIPVKHWERLYRKAMVTRGTKKGRNEFVSFNITPEEFVAEWESLQRELADKPGADKQICSQPHDDEENRLVEYMLGGVTPALMPCHVCRPDGHEKAKSERIHVKRERTPRLSTGDGIDISPDTVFSTEELTAMVVTHNELVKQLSEPTAWDDLAIMFDYERQSFRPLKRHDQSFTAFDVTKIIKSYRKIVESREAVN